MLVALAATATLSLGCATTGEQDAGSTGTAPDRRTTSGGPTASSPATPTCATGGQAALGDGLDRLERREGGRVGVHLLDTGTGESVGHRQDERFAFASTVKALLAAVVLDRLPEAGLERRLRWTEADLVDYSPVTEQHVDGGLTVAEVLEAAVTVSDNTAANLLLELVGGPAGLDRALAEVGDETTEAVRTEPTLNDFTPGDPRDTSTPRALAESLAAFAVGDALGEGDRQVLVDLLRRNTTGDDLVRAAAPEGWVVGDKTGTADWGTRNDIAVLEPPGREPIVLAVLTRGETADAEPRDALVAEVARIALDAVCAER